MKTFHLVFADAAAALAAFAAVTGEPVAGLADVPSWVWPSGRQCAIDVIGPVDAAAGEVDADARPIVGFRVNVLAPDDATLPDALAPAEVHPVRPTRVFG
jgi:hypothetical protein